MNTTDRSARKIALYSRPWMVELSIALEDYWTKTGSPLVCEHLTQHREDAERLAAKGRSVRFLTQEVESIDVPDPAAALVEIEGRYGDGLWPMNRYRLAERFFEGRDPNWQLDQVARYALWFDRYFADVPPVAMVGDVPDVTPMWLGYDIARCHGSKVVALRPSVVPANTVQPMADYAEIEGAKERYEQLCAVGLSETDRDRAQGFRATAPHGTGLSYLYLRTRRDRVRRLLGARFLREQIAHTRLRARERRAGNWFLQPTSWQWIRYRLTAKLRGPLVDRRYLTAPKPKRPFLFFPLHFQPEASTLINGSYFVNQIEAIKNLARSVPIDWEIAVKEHFMMRGQRGQRYYRDLQKIPNVSLTALDVPTVELIDEAKVVAVISSNAGLEASLRGKSVLLLGETAWDYAPTVREVGRLIDLPATIAETAGASLDPADDQVLAFALSWGEALPEAKRYEHPEYGWADPDNIPRLAAVIESKLGPERSPAAPPREARTR